MSSNPFEAPGADGSAPRDFDHIDIPASAGLRLGAYLIDSLCAGVFMAGAILVLVLSGLDLEDPIIGLASNVVSFGTFMVYGAAFEASPWRATPGKRLLGMQIAKVGGEDATAGDAIVRNLVKWLGLSVCGLLAFTVLSKEGSSVWDGITGTLVVRRVPVTK